MQLSTTVLADQHLLDQFRGKNGISTGEGLESAHAEDLSPAAKIKRDPDAPVIDFVSFRLSVQGKLGLSGALCCFGHIVGCLIQTAVKRICRFCQQIS